MSDVIENIEIIEHFNGFPDLCGIYIVTINGKKRIFTRNGNVVKVLGHFTTGDSLDIIRDDLRAELFNKLPEVTP